MPPKKDLTDDEKFALQLQAEQDLARFQRQYILLERDRQEIALGTGKTAKQRNVLRILKNEQNELLLDLKVADAPAKKRADELMSKELSSLLEEYDSFSEQFVKKTTHLKEVNDQIKMVKKDVIDLKAQLTTDRQLDEKLWLEMKHLETLENKLEVQIKKFCWICYENRQMREQIDHHLKERVSFLKTWDKMIKTLNVGKKYMLDLIEQATIAYDQREEWCSKLQALRMKAHKDLCNHIEEMRVFVRKQDENKKLEDFFMTKGQKRIMRDLEQKELEKRQERREKMQETLEHYQEIVDNITVFLDEENIQEIAQIFLKRESENFTLFKYINDLNKEMEELNDKLSVSHMEIDNERILYENRNEHQKLNLSNFEMKLEEARNEANEAEAYLKAIDSNLKGMMQGVEQLFKFCKCNNDPILKLLGSNQSINFYNVLIYQELLEKRIHNLMLYGNYRDKIRKSRGDHKIIAEDKGKGDLFKIEEIVQTSPCPLCVEHEQVSDVIDTLQKVLSKDDVKEKLRKRLLLPDGLARLHNVSACHLPKSREIIQKRYQ